MTKFIGIDTGYHRCGFAILEENKNGEIKLIEYGTIETMPSSSMPARLHELAQDLENIIKEFKPKFMGVEDLFFGRNVTNGINVAQARGVILEVGMRYGLQISEPKPVEVKNSFTGDGRADKIQMKNMAKLIFEIDKKALDDAIDAIVVGYWAIKNKNLLVFPGNNPRI